MGCYEVLINFMWLDTNDSRVQEIHPGTAHPRRKNQNTAAEIRWQQTDCQLTDKKNVGNESARQVSAVSVVIDT